MTATRYPLSFYLALAANFFFFASFQWTYATLPGYVQAIGGDLFHVGLATGLFALSAVAVRPAVGWLADHWGRKPLLVAGAALFVLSPVLYAVLDRLWPFMAARVVHGVGIAAFTTAYTAVVVDVAPAERRGEAVGLAGITSNLGLLFMPALGLATASGWGYTVHWALAAALGGAGLLLALLLHEEPAAHAILPTGPRWAVARRRPVWVAAFGATGLAVAYGAALSFMAPLAAERELTAAGTYFSAFALALMAAQAAAGWLSDRVGRRAVAVPGLAVAAVAAATLAWAHSNPVLLGAGALLGLSWGLVRTGIDTGVVDAVGSEARGTALGFLYTCFDAGVGVGSFGLGLAVQAWGYPAAFYLAAGWAVIGLAVYLGLNSPRLPRP